MGTVRRRTKTIKIGNVYIGSGYPIAIQSMTKTKTSHIKKTIRQIKELENTGCEIIRVAVKDNSDAQAINKIKSQINLPLVADIHFDWRLALEAIENGADKIRLNPGNIYKKEQIREIAKAAKINSIPIRVGINSGSLPAVSCQLSVVRNTAQIMTQTALDYIKILEEFGFYDIVVSLKSSNIIDTIEAYRKLNRLCDYPFHLGLTASGTSYSGIIKSSLAIGNLLLEGIGDTIRISLTDKPQAEVRVAQAILQALGLRRFSPEVISCPTCGRCEVDLLRIVKEIEKKIIPSTDRNCRLPLKVAIMGCVVNGPGEAREADIGLAFGKKQGLLFKKGRALRKVTFDKCIDVLLEEILKRDNKS